MMKRLHFLPLLVLALALTACGISEADIQLTVVAAETNAVSTAYVQLTEHALANPSATPTPQPSPTFEPTATLQTTATQTTGGTGAGTGTGSTTSCGAMTFVSDVTIPDGEEVAAGTPFTKTWSVQNSGACEWTTAFSLAFSHGDQMGGPTSNPLPASIAVGANGNLSVALVAPNTAGEYVGHWALMDANGVAFGYLYVEIKVP